MPQLVPFYFFNQILFVSLILVVLVYVFSKYILPKYVVLNTVRFFLSKF